MSSEGQKCSSLLILSILFLTVKFVCGWVVMLYIIYFVIRERSQRNILTKGHLASQLN